MPRRFRAGRTRAARLPRRHLVGPAARLPPIVRLRRRKQVPKKTKKKNHNVFDILGPTRIIESRNRPNVQRIVPSEKELVRRPKTELKRGRLF